MSAKSDQITVVIVSAIPLFYAVSGIEAAILLGGSVLFSLLVFETVLFFVKRFWLPSLQPLLALVVFAVVLKAISLVYESLLGWSSDRTAQIFPLTLVSTFLLSQSVLTMRESFGTRLRALGRFLGLLLLIGISCQWSGTFQMFLPASFWVSGVALAAFFLLKRRIGS